MTDSTCEPDRGLPEYTGEARKDSVRHLLFLYSVVGALSLETAISSLIDPDGSGFPVNLEALPTTLAFAVTLIPFFHGALRHLDEFHVFGSGPALRRGALLADFVSLFLQVSVLYALASFTGNYQSFLGALILLLLIDIVWAVASRTLIPVHRMTMRDVWGQVKAVAVRFSRTGTTGALPELAWAFNNMFWVIALGLLFIFPTTISGIDADDMWFGYAILGIAASRTFLDYNVAWEFYFPSDSGRERPQPEARAYPDTSGG